LVLNILCIHDISKAFIVTSVNKREKYGSPLVLSAV